MTDAKPTYCSTEKKQTNNRLPCFYSFAINVLFYVDGDDAKFSRILNLFCYHHFFFFSFFLKKDLQEASVTWY